MIQALLIYWQHIRCWFWRFRKFWRSLYYGITNLLMIVGASLILSVIWCLWLFRWR